MARVVSGVDIWTSDAWDTHAGMITRRRRNDREGPGSGSAGAGPARAYRIAIPRGTGTSLLKAKLACQGELVSNFVPVDKET